jgi:hypothetical protein
MPDTFLQAMASAGMTAQVVLLLALALGVGVFAWYQISWRREKPGLDVKRAATYALLSLLLVAGTYVPFLLVLKYPTQGWYFLPVVLITALMLDALLAGESWLRIVRPALAIALVVAAWSPVSSAVSIRRTNLDIVADTLRARAGKDDLVIVDPWYYAVSLQRYYKGETPVVTIPPVGELGGIHRYDLVKASMADTAAQSRVIDSMTKTLRGGGAIWVVGGIERVQDTSMLHYPGPPPLETSGWFVGPYAAFWSRRTGYLLTKCAAENRAVPDVNNGSINPLENCSLFVYRGWKP